MNSVGDRRRRLNAMVVVGLLACLGVVMAVIQHRASTSLPVANQSSSAPMLGMLVDQHLRVVDVDAMGSAARAGIQPGDILRKIGSVSLPATVSIDPRSAAMPVAVPTFVRTSNGVKGAFRAAVPVWERPVTIVLERNGASMALHVLVTSTPFHYDAANPPPTVTPVPSSQDATTFYL